VRARGTEILFADGRWRTCGTSGLWNVNLGYGNKPIADAIAAALLDASYLTLFRSAHEPAIRASRALLDLCGADHFGRVIYSTSGSAANDLVMKLVRQYWSLHRQFRRRVVVGFRNSYHGLTYGSHGLTGSPLGQSYYSVDQSLVRHVSHTDPAELEQLLAAEGQQVAALVVEPVLGTGAFEVGQPMLDAIQRLREHYGFLLVADEVATGFGRTGTYFASARWQVPPDVLIVSKGLTNGTCAVAAVLASDQICERFERSDAALTHAETQAGTPATSAAIIATIEQMDELNAIERGRGVAAQLTGIISGLSDHPLVTGTGGVGCFRAIRLSYEGEPLDGPAITEVVEAIRAHDALVQPGPGCIQLVPALVMDDGSLSRLAAAVRAGLDSTYEALAQAPRLEAPRLEAPDKRSPHEAVTLIAGYVPVIDMTSAYEGSPADQLVLAEAMAQACRSSGFFVVSGHRVPRAVVDGMLTAVAEFFALPQEAKLELLADPADPLSRGFSWPARPRDGADAEATFLVSPDLVESFVLNRLGDHRSGRPLPDGADPRLTLPNKMPALPGFQEACDAYYTEMGRLAIEIMGVLALALGLSRHWFDDKFDAHMSSLAANFYPPQLTSPKSGQLRKGAHSDWGTLTVLRQDEITSGLQVWHQETEWVDVPVVPGTFVVNIGDLMARWTNDKWSSTVHRVVNPPPDAARRPRYSLAFFHQPNFDAQVSCIPSCAEADSGSRHRPIAAFDFISAKARRAYMEERIVLNRPDAGAP